MTLSLLVGGLGMRLSLAACHSTIKFLTMFLKTDNLREIL